MITTERPFIRILVVDDHPMLREGLATMIESEADLTLVADAGTGSEAIAQFEKHHPDITLMDLRLPDMNGIEVIEAIRRRYPAARIIVLTTYLGDVQALRALKAGALGYLLKASLRLELVDTIRAVYAGKRRLHADVASELAAHAMDDALTQRELDVLNRSQGAARTKSLPIG